MQVELFFKCFVVHFALSHAVLLIFHFTVGMKKVVPLIRSRLENVSFQYAYLLPHDFVFTFMFIFFIDQQMKVIKSHDVSDYVSSILWCTLCANAVCEMRVLFYFYEFPGAVSFGMFAVRSAVHVGANMLIVHMYIQPG